MSQNSNETINSPVWSSCPKIYFANDLDVIPCPNLMPVQSARTISLLNELEVGVGDNSQKTLL